MTTPRIIFCGDRNWSDTQFIYDVMDFIKSTLGNFVVIEGEAQGADSLARACAKAGLPVWVSTSGFDELEEFVKKLKGE